LLKATALKSEEGWREAALRAAAAPRVARRPITEVGGERLFSRGQVDPNLFFEIIKPETGFHRFMGRFDWFKLIGF
jgi:hypothetical protein